MDRSQPATVPYHLGLDVGTNSVGWAVTDRDYQLLKCKRNAMRGARLFDTAQDASGRVPQEVRDTRFGQNLNAGGRQRKRGASDPAVSVRVDENDDWGSINKWADSLQIKLK